ncbi:MAG: hypothetical protein JWM43_3023 [Acidobacteriaceae bacterium]|nr:hypothetical protein [Acidobacteriaceae bacterium]
MQTILKPRAYEAALATILLLCLAVFFYKTIHWPLVGDATLIHYVAFLSDHGLKPYQNIGDVNMPGAYAIDWTVMHLFGDGVLPWRLFDLALLLIGGGAMYTITRPRGWFPGLFAASLFALAHGRDGIAQLGQRDLSIAVLLLLACAALFHAHRTPSPRAEAFIGLFAGIACTVKPTAFPFALGLILLLALGEKRAGRNGNRPILRAIAGSLLPLAAVALWLSYHHLWRAYRDTLNGNVRYHAGVARHSLGYLLSHSLSPFLPLAIASVLLLGLSLRLSENRKMQWDTVVLSVCTVLGMLSYCLQAKGYPYQRYPFLAFLLLLIANQLSAALEWSRCERILAAVALAIAVLVIAPISAFKAISYDYSEDPFGTALQQDLIHLGGPALSGHVQCLDTFSGCIGTLYRMKLVQSTSLMYDEFLFGPESNGTIARNRALFWQQLQQKPPEVFILSKQLYPNGPDTFDKLLRWPEFARYLHDNYVLFHEFNPTQLQNWGGRPTVPAGYRIYIPRDPTPHPDTDLFEVTSFPNRLGSQNLSTP